MTRTSTRFNLIFINLGAAVLLLKGHYSGPFKDIVHSYAGNLSVSFAVYYLVRLLATRWGLGQQVTAGIALLVVELFELTNGFGVMENVYDPVDLVVNAAGVGLGVGVDK